ncbi:MAG: methyltransferase domain-containing protein [Xanthomonadaceae bacterium]|nr:methyltransferase domain-containing protein [Xanthomonadaceae bacterium]
MRCGASVIHLSLGVALQVHMPDIAASDVYELSARGPLVAYLRRHARSLIVSEYLPEVPRGTHRNGVGSEDVQCLTFPDASFDLVTHTEVLEHVPDDSRAFRELRRVLRPGGVMLFTVPLHGAERTVERARLRDGATTHLLSPAYHGDPLRAGQRILVYRDYGRDIVGRLAEAGFTRVLVHSVDVDFRLIRARNVIVAYAPNR